VWAAVRTAYDWPVTNLHRVRELVEVDGTTPGEVGPEALLGERAVLEGERRTATLIAATPVRLGVATLMRSDPTRLAQLAESHRREG
jgi:CRP-like cAMP-binding protein